MWLRLFFLCLVFITTTISYAQIKRGQQRADSLMAVVNDAKKDTHQVKALCDLSLYYRDKNLDSGFMYGEQALTLAKGIKWQKGIGTATWYIGNIYRKRSQQLQALKWYERAAAIFKEDGLKSEYAILLGLIGQTYYALYDFPKALELNLNALTMKEALNDSAGIALTKNTLSGIFEKQGNYEKALEYSFAALKYYHAENAYSLNTGRSYNRIAGIYASMKAHTRELEYYMKSLEVSEKLKYFAAMSIDYDNVGVAYTSLKKFPLAVDYSMKAMDMYRQGDDSIGIANVYCNLANIFANVVKEKDEPSLRYLFNGDQKKALSTARLYVDSSILIARMYNEAIILEVAYKHKSTIAELQGDNATALQAFKQAIAIKDSMLNTEKAGKMAELQLQYEREKIETLQRKEMKKEKLIRNGFMGGFALMLAMAGFLFYQRRKTIKAGKKADEIGKKNEALLLNILPAEVAHELQTTGTAKAKAYTMVTVMLTDFKDFTTVSQKISAELLVDEIHHCFSAFDHIVQKYNIEKIKTIGDAYLCAGGLPVSNYTHASDILHAAFEIREFMKMRRHEKLAKGEVPFEIRIGVTTGPVVAGVVGVKKYVYDIWGDTVNVAARMEQNSEAGKINISGQTYELVKDTFNCEYRGKIAAKNKGEIDMYFVEKQE